MSGDTINYALADQEENLPIANHAVNSTPPTQPIPAHNDVPERPKAAYLRHLMRTLTADPTTPAAIRSACDELMRAISANDLPAITDQVAGLARLADAEGIVLPRLETEASPSE
jgi:hypothetical protein